MDKLKKRFIAIFMAMAMTLCFTISAFAAEPVDVISPASTISTEEASTRSSVGDVIAAGSTQISGGSGILYVTLPTWNLFADLQAGIGYIDNNNIIVKCSVRTPSGTIINLGAISGNGSRTSPYEITLAESGTYAFYFTSASTTPYEVVGYIFD